MIAFYRTVCVAPGRTTDAMTFAKEIAGYIKNTFGLDVEVMLPIGGNPMRVGWASRYQDLGALDAMSAKMLGDKKYLEKVAKASDCFIAGSMMDSIWRTI